MVFCVQTVESFETSFYLLIFYSKYLLGIDIW